MATEISTHNNGLDPIPYTAARALATLIAAEEDLVKAQLRRDEAVEWYTHITGMMLAKAPTEAPTEAPTIPERPGVAPEPPPAPPEPRTRPDTPTGRRAALVDQEDAMSTTLAGRPADQAYGASILSQLSAAERLLLDGYTRRALDHPDARPSDEEWRVLDRVEALIARAGGRTGYTKRPRQRERRCRS